MKVPNATKFIVFLVLFSSLFFSRVTQVVAITRRATTPTPSPTITPSPTPSNIISDIQAPAFLGSLVNFNDQTPIVIFLFVALLLLGIFLLGLAEWLTSAGDSAKSSGGKMKCITSIVGLITLLIAFLFLHAIIQKAGSAAFSQSLSKFFSANNFSGASPAPSANPSVSASPTSSSLLRQQQLVP